MQTHLRPSKLRFEESLQYARMEQAKFILVNYFPFHKATKFEMDFLFQSYLLQLLILGRFIIHNYTLSLEIAMNQTIKETIQILQQIFIQIRGNRFRNIAERVQKNLMLAYIRKQSHQISWHLQRIREALKVQLKYNKPNSNQSLADLTFCIALASELTNHRQTESDYQLALKYDGANPLSNITFALFLYQRHQSQKGLRYLSTVKVSTAFQEKHRKQVWLILLYKVKRDIYLELLKPKRNIFGGEQIKKKQFIRFIRQILHFKECFLYRCTQIQSLSQNSYSQLAWMLFYSNRFEDGLTLAYKLRIINTPTTQITQLKLAELFFSLGKFGESVECGEQALRINPRNQSVHYYLIKALGHLNKLSQAKDCALRLININKYNHLAYQSFGAILLKWGYLQLGVYSLGLAVMIQQSEATYGILAFGLFRNGKLVQAERCYLKSIRIKPMESNYSFLGQLYFSTGAYLNAIHCFIQAAQLNCTELTSFYCLGVCAKEDRISKLIINRLIEQLKSVSQQNLFLQTNLAVFYFISKQSQSQFFDFVVKFLSQRKEEEQTVYSDIATKLIQGYSLIGVKYQCLDVVFAAEMGYLGRVKENYSQTHQIYVGLMDKWKANKTVSVVGAFTAMYQTQISKTPKEVQAITLQFIIAEMVQQSTEYAIQCYFKSLSYAEGDYEQFHLQLFKKISKDIDELEPIDYIANSVFGKQYLSSEDAQVINDTLRRNKFLDLRCYVCSLEVFAQILRKLRQIQELGYPQKQSVEMINYLSSNYIIRYFGLGWRTKEVKQAYTPIYKQIQTDQQGLKAKLDRLTKIYNKKYEYKQLLRAFTPIIQAYFDKFAINQKVKLIFNHFYPFVLSQSCHKQFAYTLTKLKNSLQYSSWELKEDLESIFKEANKQKGKEWEPQRINDNQSVASSVMSTVISYPLIDVNSQTRSQTDGIDKQFESFIFYEADEVRSKISRKNSDSNIESFAQDDYREFMGQINEQEQPEKIVKIFKVSCGEKGQLLIDAQDCSEEQLSSQESEIQFDISQKEEQKSQVGEGQAAQWFQKQYFSHKTPFASGRRLYRKFYELLHLNTFAIIKQLSKNTTLKHVANHICWQSSINSNQTFTAKVELGEQVNDEFLEGPIYAFGWIIDIALGITELQKLGIYHADLFFRNTIRVRRGNIFSFKIIDFDKAFKTKKSEKKDKGFECTRNMFDFWLRFKFDGTQRAPVYHLDIQSDSGVSTESSTLYSQRQIIEYVFMGAEQSLVQTLLAIKQQSIFSSEKMQQCLSLLQQHMVKSHLEQYSALVEKLLLGDSQTERQIRREVIGEEKIAAILEELGRLKEEKVDYIQFAENVKKVGGLAVQGQREE